MNKCEWKDGEFVPCDAFDPSAHDDGTMKYHPHCNSCGKSISKPEPPEPLIVKSGDTWVAEYKSINYLMTHHNLAKSLDRDQSYSEGFFRDHKQQGYWKPFSEIELTDEIAKLRPLVIAEDDGTRGKRGGMLIAVDDHNSCIFTPFTMISTRIDHDSINNTQLATAKEIQEAQE